MEIAMRDHPILSPISHNLRTGCNHPWKQTPRKPGSAPLCPSASVSAGLCEMYVAIGRQRSHALLVPDVDSLARLDLADARQRESRELLLPRVQHQIGVAAGDREEQFEV